MFQIKVSSQILGSTTAYVKYKPELGANITHNATLPLTSLEAVYQITCSILWSHEIFYKTTYAVVSP